MKKSSAKAKAVILVISLLILIAFPTGCMHSRYRGDHPEAYSAILAAAPGVRGFASNGEALYDSYIGFLQEDGYGRKLFGYSEDYGETYLVIVQCSDDANVYYYSEDCYAYVKEAYENISLDSSEVDALKVLNDWEQPIDREKCERTEIIRDTPDGKIDVYDTYFEGIVEEYHKSSGRYIHPSNVSFVRTYDFLCSDADGKELYVLRTHFEEFTEKTEIYYSYTFLVLINPDKSYDPSCVVIVDDITAPQQQIKAIKAQGGWSKRN